ncbi:hypothetical protein GCM10025866_26670 [Naasia aerilata]|uniref:Uncharacterized protein n=1 Tax=Naasia aerilata TaxID=1162966 RepID=A0ABN6XRG0_9MICO|nr:hypothetical protein GCM10025866_26670 [Naasia aerilata]
MDAEQLTLAGAEVSERREVELQDGVESQQHSCDDEDLAHGNVVPSRETSAVAVSDDGDYQRMLSERYYCARSSRQSPQIRDA